VLVGASMPAVLVEVGFISNPAEEAKLKSAEFQQTLADAIGRAVVKFFAKRKPAAVKPDTTPPPAAPKPSASLSRLAPSASRFA